MFHLPSISILATAALFVAPTFCVSVGEHRRARRRQVPALEETSDTVQLKGAWYEQATSYHFPQTFAHDLSAATITSTLANVKEKQVLIEFYKPWCPRCQHMAPHFEMIAYAIGSSPNSSAFVATVDCVRDHSICQEYDVHKFPSILMGSPQDFLGKQRSLLVDVPMQGRDATGIAEFLANSTSISINLDKSNITPKDIRRLIHQRYKNQVNVSVVHTAAAEPWDAQLAAALFLRNVITNYAWPKISPQDNFTDMSAMLDFVSLLADRIPETSPGARRGPCGDSFAKLHGLLAENWTQLLLDADPSPQEETISNVFLRPQMRWWSEDFEALDMDKIEDRWQLCGRSWQDAAHGFRSCRGTWPNKRGLTCGLWTMFHSVAARSTDQTALHDLNVLRNAISHFFECEDCREHFVQIPFNESEIKTKHDAQLWWWRAHNIVNERVKKEEEEEEDEDPAFVKNQWPTSLECPRCRETTRQRHGFLDRRIQLLDAVAKKEWRLDEVIAFLDRSYGNSAA
eukprot:gnl/TRDRNA2_/TRDRNA2_166510_c0_seq2.p1 gnl/TRDRNA2_/TRDRNA2_166510_c0~~gnl/TRDRNA2_/TRDRNA2_166510_c0_seq2.p1  ORF type:complete len:514 (+),score=76.39 gnl/TRDRNA2_/TRDRNA2_166510_c0_seq2:25-1566(+)